MKPDKVDVMIAKQAEREAITQLAIIRLLKPFDHRARVRVIEAAFHIVDADALVPGILAKVVKP